MSLTCGARIGWYEVTAQVGVGGMGEVYRATDTNLKRQFESKLFLNLREDFATTLGGEFAVAFDGPLLPTPARGLWSARG